MKLKDEIDNLYHKLSEHSITPVEWERLCDLLRSHAVCREHWSNLYIDEQALKAVLADSRFSSELPAVQAISRQKRTEPKRLLLSKTLLISLGLGLFLFGIFFSLLKPNEKSDLISSKNETEIFDVPTEKIVSPDAAPLGRIVRLSNVQWKDAAVFSEWQFVTAGNRLQFEKGAIEILLNEGIHLILEGPADMTILEAKRSRLLYGKMGTRVSRQGIGFTIETPLGIVVDQGTEFGLEVDRSGDTKVVVFQGKVDVYQHPSSSEQSVSLETSSPIPLDKGEGLQFKNNSKPQPVGTIEANHFLMAALQRPVPSHSAVTSVYDNFREKGSKKYYEIVPRGFAEDVLAYVDRQHEWNGVTSDGLPDFLIGGDLIRTFNDDKFVDDYHLTVNLAGPARLFVLYDNRLQPPDWLLNDFAPTKYLVGLDEGISPQERERRYDQMGLKTPEERVPDNLWNKQRALNQVGPGRSIDEIFTVWERKSTEPGDVVLGGLKYVEDYQSRSNQCFYGIVVVPF